MAKITDYPSITTIDANTILLADGSSGTGKILASDMAKYALETYAGSTLAGSAQSVKNAFSNLFANGSNIDASNVDSLKTNAIYCRYIEAATITGFPIMSSGFGLFIVSNGTSTAERVGQYIFMPNSGTMAMRYDDNGTWGPWKMDASTIIKITTSIIDYVDALPGNSLIKLWSSAADGTKVGSPFGTSSSAYYEVDKINASTAYIKAKAMVRGVADQDVVYIKQRYGTGWADNWTKVPTRAEVDVVVPKVKTAISDLSSIQPGEQGYMQFTADVSPIGTQAYFTVWCTGNADRRGLIAVYTAGTETRVFANAGHATSGVFAWRGWAEYADMTAKAGTFTPDSSLTNLGENGIKVWQSGKVVIVSGYLQASFPSTTNIQVGTISGVGTPQNPIRARGGCGPNAYSTGNDAYVAITRDGKITAYSAGAGTSLYFTIAYITA